MARLVETECCGIRELDGIQGSNVGQVLKDAAYFWIGGGLDGAYIFFSVTSRYTKLGKRLAEQIEALGLGTVLKTKPTKNPNSGNMLTMYLWTVNKKNMASYHKKHG